MKLTKQERTRRARAFAARQRWWANLTSALAEAERDRILRLRGRRTRTQVKHMSAVLVWMLRNAPELLFKPFVDALKAGYGDDVSVLVSGAAMRVEPL